MLAAAAELVGATFGAAAGAAMPGAVGAGFGGLAGGMVTVCLRRVGEEIAGRYLSSREQMRLGAVYSLAQAKIAEKVAAGTPLRDDGFFDEGPAGRSTAEEVFEAI